MIPVPPGRIEAVEILFYRDGKMIDLANPREKLPGWNPGIREYPKVNGKINPSNIPPRC
jgi:hypothetical protein